MDNLYFYLGGERIAYGPQLGDYGLYFYYNDQLGNVRAITNSSQSVCFTSDYYPFGGNIPGTYTNTCPTQYRQFTGKDRDPVMGVDYFGARYYKSDMSRFFSPDPNQDSGFEHMDDPQSWNGYAYTRDSPLSLIDPDGRNYLVCDNTGHNCADLTDLEYDQYRKENQSQTVNASGDIYQTNPDGSSTKVGHETYYNEKDILAAQMLARTGVTLSDPRTIVGFYGGSAFLGAGIAASPLIGGATLTTLSIPFGLQPGAVIGGFILTEHAVEQAAERGVTLDEISEALSGVAKSNPQNGFDSVKRFYTATCEVRVNTVTGTIVTVISKIKR